MAFNFGSTTERVFLTGKVKYCNALQPSKFNKWNCNIYLDKESYEKVLVWLEKDRIMNKLQKDDDGYYMNFSRPVAMETRKGKIIPFNPPIVLDSDGETQLANCLIGPGSDVEIKLEKYPFGTEGKHAVRWEAVRVITLVQPVVQSFPKKEQQQAWGLTQESKDIRNKSKW
jgi:hypothetical protein